MTFTHTCSYVLYTSSLPANSILAVVSVVIPKLLREICKISKDMIRIMRMCMQVYIYVHIYMYIRMYMYIYIYIYMCGICSDYIILCVCVCVCVCVCIYVCMYVLISRHGQFSGIVVPIYSIVGLLILHGKECARSVKTICMYICMYVAMYLCM